MTKALRSNSVDAAVKAALTAGEPAITPPAHVRLRAADLPFWRAVIHARARHEWEREADLVVAGQLARCMADIESQTKQLDAEGSIIDGRVNPRAAVVDGLVRRQLAYMRSLRMAGAAAGDPRDEAGRRRLEQTARRLHAELRADDPDGLLA